MGIISGLFDKYLPKASTEGVDLAKKVGKSVARGVQTMPQSFVDLASLPFLGFDKFDPSSVPGSSAWADKKGYNIPKQEGNTPTEQFFLDTGEIGGSMLGPSIMGGAISGPVSVVKAWQKAGRAVEEGITRTRGELTGDLKMLEQEAKLAKDPKFAQGILQWTKNQNDRAKNVVNGFARSIKQVPQNDTVLGKRIQKNFGDYWDGIEKKYTDTRKRLYGMVEDAPGSSELLPVPQNNTAMNRINTFIDSKMGANTPNETRELLEDLRIRATNAFQMPTDLKSLTQARVEASNTYKPVFGQESKYAKAGSGLQNAADAVFKAGIDDRIDDGFAAGSDALKEAVGLYRNADHVFEITTNQINKMKKESLNTFLKNADNKELTPELIAARFKKMTPSERKFFESAANKVDPEMIESVRRATFDDLAKAGTDIASSTNQSDFNFPAFTQNARKMQRDNPELLDFVIGPEGSAGRQSFNEIIDIGRDVANASPGLATDSRGVRQVIAAGAGAGIGKVGAARAADATFGVLENLFTDKAGLYEHLFHGGPKPKGVIGTAINRVTPGLKEGVDAGGTLTGMQAGAAANIASDAVNAPPPPQPMQGPPVPPPPDTSWQDDVDPEDLAGAPTGSTEDWRNDVDLNDLQ